MASPKQEEAVALGRGRCRTGPPAGPDEGVDEREERRPGHVEVGQQPVDHQEVEVAVDEQVGPPRWAPVAAADSRARTTVVPTATTRSPAAHARAPRPGRRSARRAWVVLDPVGGDGAEGAEPDVELDRRHLGTRARQASSSAVGQVQAGGRRGDRPGPAGVDGLVALGVLERAVDVGREGHLAVAEPVAGRTSTGAAPPPGPRPPRARRPVAERGARRDPAARPYQRLPAGARPRRSRSSTSTAPPVALRSRSRAGTTRVSLTTSRSPGAEQVGQVGDRPVARWRAGAGVDQQPGRAAGSIGSWAMASGGRS